MKIKKGKKIFLSDDFWYSLFDGGCIKPEELLIDKEDIEMVNKAMEILLEFKESCEKRLNYM